jgi:hypothetical protein
MTKLIMPRIQSDKTDTLRLKGKMFLQVSFYTSCFSRDTDFIYLGTLIDHKKECFPYPNRGDMYHVNFEHEKGRVISFKSKVEGRTFTRRKDGLILKLELGRINFRLNHGYRSS